MKTFLISDWCADRALLPFPVYGSAQLRGHKHLRPKAIHDADILEEFSKDYMYLSYIRYINSVSRTLT